MIFILPSKLDFGIQMNLVICEKNISANRIAYILSNGSLKTSRLEKIPVYEFYKDNNFWQVVGLKGHIINLDFPSNFNKWDRIDPIELINVNPIKNVTEKNIASLLNKLVDKTPSIIIATDYDREGELIGVEALNLMKQYNNRLEDIKRAKFSSITNYEITKAFETLTEVDYNLSNAGETRQIIDLIWGAVLTRFISLTSKKLGKDFLSIGRVQSPTLALLVKRENEINNFRSKTYWKIIAHLEKNIKFDAVHSKDQFWNENEAKNIFLKIKNCKKAEIKEVNKKINRELPPSPFNTTTFLNAASHLGFSAAKAMSISEDLYINGLISYPRTDNTVYPQSLNLNKILQKLSKSIFSNEVEEVLNKRRKRPTRGKKHTTDHPPIHPVGVPKRISKSHQIIYELIVRRFLATLTEDAISETTQVKIDIDKEKFISNGYRLLESNWRNIYKYFKEKKKSLPNLIKGEKIDILKIILKQNKTKPPHRYTQGSLILKMEELSLGTKSTRPEIIQKLYSRKYITLSPLAPTLTAIAVIGALNECEVVRPQMTATLEKDMDTISQGNKTLNEVVNQSRKMLSNVMIDLEKFKEDIERSISEADKKQNKIGICPRCGKDMLIRQSKKNKRFVGCSGFPDCKNTYSLPQKGIILSTDKTCDICGSPTIRIKYKYKKPWNLCLNPDCDSKKSKNLSIKN
jgi:DNA topoisomerase-1